MGVRRHVARFGAPALFLAAATVAVLLVRAGLDTGETATTTTGTRTSRATTRVTPRAPVSTATRPAKRHRRRTSQPRYYAIRGGDTLATVAQDLGTTVEALQRLNPNVDSSSMQIGQRIRVK